MSRKGGIVTSEHNVSRLKTQQQQQANILSKQHYLNWLQEFSASFADGTIWKSVVSQALCITATLDAWTEDTIEIVQPNNFHNRLWISSSFGEIIVMVSNSIILFQI